VRVSVKPKLSVFVRSALIFTSLYLGYMVVLTTIDADKQYRVDLEKWVNSAATFSRFGEALLKQGDAMELDDRLSLALAAHQIHFYLIRQDGRDVFYGNEAGPEDRIMFVNQPGTYSNENYRYIVSQVGDFQLIVGHKTSFKAYMGFFWNELGRDKVIDLFLEIFGFVGIMLFSFRDLRSILKRMTERGATRGDLALAKSSETLTLVRGLQGFENQAQALKTEKDTFRSQVLPALRRELESGKKPPYEFACTLVRTDINNFTQVFMSEKRTEFMGAINDFFVGVTHLVSRYNGSVYEFVGDEVLFYFKDEDHNSSSAVAISALRDIHKLAQRLNETTEEKGYSFKIKSSVAHGLLRFGPLVDAHALAGPPLIETVRMLSHVHEKSENTVLFDESMTDSVSELCRSTKQQVVMLKGLKGARSLVTLEAFTPLSLHLRQADANSLKNATYYRDDDDVVEILNFVKANYGKIESSELNLLVSLFRQYSVAKTSPEVKRAYVDCLNELSHAHDHNEKDVYLYASLVSAANHILSDKEWAGEVRASMYGCLTHPNRRVVANALDIFATFEPEAGEKIFTELAKSGDNRIEANSLVKEAKRKWQKKNAQWLKTMLKAPSPYAKASALYALGEIAKHFRETDEVAFSSDAELQSLLEQIPKLCEHANAMVRRQALSAQAKAGRAKAEAKASPGNVTPLKKIS
jgi:class 3 adenylate cyclase